MLIIKLKFKKINVGKEQTAALKIEISKWIKKIINENKSINY
jgi:hypothetical protein